MKLSTHSLNKASKTQNKNIVTFVVDSVLHLWAFVTLVGVVTFVGATSPNRQVIGILCDGEYDPRLIFSSFG